MNPRRPAAAYAVMQDACYYKCLGNVQAEEVGARSILAREGKTLTRTT